MQSKNIAKRKLTIAYLLDDTLDKPDGVQQCVITIGEHMRAQGHIVHYLVADTSRTDLENVHSLVKFVSLKFNGNSVRTPLPATKKKIKELLASLDIDVLHVQMPYSPFFAARVINACPNSVRIVGTWHTFPTGTLQGMSHIPLYWAIRRSLRRVAVTVGVSKPTAEFADKVYKTKSIVIPNAVELSRFIIEPKKHKGRKRIVFLGRFDERKGPMKLIMALAHIKANSVLPTGLEVIMGGKGPDLLKCIDRASALGLQDTITFPGFIEEVDKPQLLGSADLCIFPSTGGEAFGISVVEAMASGQSIVLAGDNSGYRSILGEKPELLFDPSDIPQFASKLLHYLNVPRKEVDTKKLWLQLASKQYDASVVCDQLMACYRAD